MRRLFLLLSPSILAAALLGLPGPGPGPGPAVAADDRNFCAAIGTVIGHSDSRFESIAGEPGEAPGERTATVALPEATRCVVSGDLGRGAYYCRWDFSYRDRRASESFESLAEDLRQCIGHLAEEQVDQAANHPDTYLARRYDLARGSVIVSVKDKAARDGTFVFVRVESTAKID